VKGELPHKISGLTWQFLYGVALRGDLHGRERRPFPPQYYKDVAFAQGDPCKILTEEDRAYFRGEQRKREEQKIRQELLEAEVSKMCEYLDTREGVEEVSDAIADGTLRFNDDPNSAPGTFVEKISEEVT
jgi:hypothetical protein